MGYLCFLNFGYGPGMENVKICQYEKLVLSSRRGFIAYATLAVLAPLVAVALCYGLDKPSTWIARGGAVMAGLSFLADLKARDMAAVFKPSGFVGDTFGSARTKYLGQIKISLRVSVALILIGTAVWGFGDLAPLGALSAQ